MSLNPVSGSAAGRVVLVCGAATAGVGALVLAGWALGSDALAAMGTGLYPMAPNTALLFVLLGSALLVREVWPTRRILHRAVAAVALISAVVGGVTLIGFVTGLNIDGWLDCPAKWNWRCSAWCRRASATSIVTPAPRPRASASRATRSR